MTDPVTKTIDVPCPPQMAFEIFTRDMGTWWPRDKHSISAMSGNTARRVSMEPREGGALIEIGHDGTEHHWGSVTTFAPHSKLSLSWHVGRPAEEATQVDIAFEPTDAGTRVTLRHHGWDVLGDDAGTTRDGYNAGWVHVFETCFANACQTTDA